MSGFIILKTPETTHGARLCACSIRNGVMHDALNGEWRALTDDFGNVVGVAPAPLWDRASHCGYGWAYLSERMSFH